MNQPQRKQGLSAGAIVAMVIGGGMLGMFVLCCGGCLVLPAFTASARSVADARKTPRAQSAELLEFEISLLANDAQDVVRPLLTHPTTARFTHPSGQGFPLADHEPVVYAPGRYGVRGSVFAKNALGVESKHTYECVYAVEGGDFKHATLVDFEFDGKSLKP